MDYFSYTDGRRVFGGQEARLGDKVQAEKEGTCRIMELEEDYCKLQNVQTGETFEVDAFAVGRMDLLERSQ